MLPSKARWTFGQVDEAAVTELSSQLSLDPIVARLLVSRGFRSVEEAKSFLQADTGHLHDPFLFDGMDLAVNRIRKAVEQREKIRIYGDYDADGVSSTALMIRLFRELGADFDFYIPHRVKEGYGLNRGAIEQAKSDSIDLIVTVDTGISALEEIAYAAELGIEVVVTDHHEPPAVLPSAIAIINPKKQGCPYPFKQLAGAGVAFKLAQALLGRVPEELMDIAAIGTVGDLMTLTDENRIIVKLGLQRMRSGTYPGIKALLDVAGIDKKAVNAGHIGFSLAPRINASGRMGSADDAVKLLITDSPEEAKAIAASLDNLNKERQGVVDGIVGAAMAQAEQSIKADASKVIVVAGEGWNVGVIGIVASKLMDRFYRPTIVLSIDPFTGLAKGSARSIVGFDMHLALTECADLLEHYGGHQMAAGMTLHQDHIPVFQSRLQQLATEWLTEEDYVPVLNADLECQLEGQPLRWIRELEKLGPFGVGNPAPRFIFSSVRVLDKKRMGKDNRHLKLQVSNDAPAAQVGKPIQMDAVGFGKGHLEGDISSTSRVDLLGELSINEWNGMEKAQMIIQDMRIQESQVFDFRGAPDHDMRWMSLVDRCELVGIVFASQEEAEALLGPEVGPFTSRWYYSPENGTMLQVRGQTDGQYAYGDLQQVILYSLPTSMVAMTEALLQAKQAKRIYAVFKETKASREAMPGKEMFKQVYALLRHGDGQKQTSID
ncbi:MAG: single-stranded-DNA-specific exonuclease RecJ, partial [Gorillibacterium sp.]|nr:single-stranded-DNA-specific exonuclease RecJ [Gorillibacterium sp.]